MPVSIMPGIQVQADPVADFYKGKTIAIVVGFSAGGGFDLYARVISAHLGRHISGIPTDIVEQGGDPMNVFRSVRPFVGRSAVCRVSAVNNTPTPKISHRTSQSGGKADAVGVTAKPFEIAVFSATAR